MTVVSNSKLVAEATDSSLGFDPRGIALFEHSLADRREFSDEFLAALLDDYPREDLNITTMGRDGKRGEWREGRVGDVSGREVLQAVESGHLWLNIKYLHEHSRAFADLLDQLYEELAQSVGETVPRWKAGTLLISSPRAFVEYHADSIPNILWHVRGRKEVLVYPSEDVAYASREDIERICSGEQDENLPYEESYDAGAKTIELTPGNAIMWPQNAPHRVNNLEGLNISLSTEHLTPLAKRRVDVHRANRLLRRVRWQPKSIAPGGVFAPMKSALSLAHRAMRKLRRSPRVSFEWPCTFHVDANSPTGFTDEHSVASAKGEKGGGI